MKSSKLGALVASAIVGLTAGAAFAQGTGDAKACYRTHCGKSVEGHEGKCGGTRVDGISDQSACEDAGGAWTTADDAKKYEKKTTN
jgi:hypothetical protein